MELSNRSRSSRIGGNICGEWTAVHCHADRLAPLGSRSGGSGVVSGSGLEAGFHISGIRSAGGIAMMLRGLFGLSIVMLLASAPSRAQNVSSRTDEVVKQGERLFAKSCATEYCHGPRGTPGGAPRLAGRSFDQAYIKNVVMRGVPETGMASFATRFSPAELAAVVAYVATLNGISDPNISAGEAPAKADSGPALTADAARGKNLFTEALRGFGRCSTCHELGGVGIPVAGAITRVPASAAALKSLAAPNVKTGMLDGESMPVLVLNNGKQTAVFYDLTSAPPVLRNADAGSVRFTDGSNWSHTSAIAAYNDSELGAILSYLRSATRPGSSAP